MACGFAACCAERLGLSVVREHHQPHPRRLEGYAFQAARMRNNHGTWPGKAEPFRTAERQSRVNHSGRSLIWTALE